MIDISFLKLREYNKTDVDGAMHPLNFFRTNCNFEKYFFFGPSTATADPMVWDTRTVYFTLQ